MRTWLLALGVFVLLPMAQTTVLGQTTGRELLAQCEAFLDPTTLPPPPDLFGAFQQGFEQGECRGRVAGVSSMSDLIRSETARVCMPDGTNDGDRIRAVVQALRAVPDLLFQNANAVILVALANAFPCE